MAANILHTVQGYSGAISNADKDIKHVLFCIQGQKQKLVETCQDVDSDILKCSEMLRSVLPKASRVYNLPDPWAKMGQQFDLNSDVLQEVILRQDYVLAEKENMVYELLGVLRNMEDKILNATINNSNDEDENQSNGSKGTDDSDEENNHYHNNHGDIKINWAGFQNQN